MSFPSIFSSFPIYHVYLTYLPSTSAKTGIEEEEPFLDTASEAAFEATVSANLISGFWEIMLRK